MKINRVETLTKEQWNNISESLEAAAKPLANILKQFNHEGQGETDAEEFLGHMQCAVVACRYVAENAADKCLFAILDNTDLN